MPVTDFLAWGALGAGLTGVLGHLRRYEPLHVRLAGLCLECQVIALACLVLFR